MINLISKDWKLNNIETVIFDKDGTFIDLHYFWGKMTELRALEVIKKYDIDDCNFEKLCLCLGYNPNTGKMLPDGITALYSRSKIIEIFKNDLVTFGVCATESELEKIFDDVSTRFYKNMEEYTRPIEAAINFIKELHLKNIKLGIVTSDARESTILTLKHFGWDGLFSAVIGRESTPYTKESGEPTKLALELMNANPKTTIMIGDAPMDYISAKNAEIENTILVATGQIEKEELKRTSPYVVNGLNEVQILY